MCTYGQGLRLRARLIAACNNAKSPPRPLPRSTPPSLARSGGATRHGAYVHNQPTLVLTSIYLLHFTRCNSALRALFWNMADRGVRRARPEEGKRYWVQPVDGNLVCVVCQEPFTDVRHYSRKAL